MLLWMITDTPSSTDLEPWFGVVADFVGSLVRRAAGGPGFAQVIRGGIEFSYLHTSFPLIFPV